MNQLNQFLYSNHKCMEKSWKFMGQNCGDWLNGEMGQLLNVIFNNFNNFNFKGVFCVCLGQWPEGGRILLPSENCSLPLSFFATFHWFNLSFKVNMSRSVSLCTNSVNSLSLVPHTQTSTLRALTCLLTAHKSSFVLYVSHDIWP